MQLEEISSFLSSPEDIQSGNKNSQQMGPFCDFTIFRIIDFDCRHVHVMENSLSLTMIRNVLSLFSKVLRISVRFLYVFERESIISFISIISSRFSNSKLFSMSRANRYATLRRMVMTQLGSNGLTMASHGVMLESKPSKGKFDCSRA